MSDIESKAKASTFEKIKKDPAPAIGMAGFFGVVAYAAWNYRKKDAGTKPSVYVIQTRVAAQGLVIGLLTLSLGYHMYQSYRDRDIPHENALNVSQYHHHAPAHTNDQHKH